jgi:thiol:disulfide interchange protein
MNKLLVPILIVGVGVIAIMYLRPGAKTVPTPNQPGAVAGGHGEVFTTASYAEAKASAGDKLLLVDATATWCPPCKEMEKSTWPSEDVKAWVGENALAVQVDVDKDKAAAGELKIKAMPTVILFRGGKELGRHVGYLGPAELVSWLKKTAA